MIVYKDTVHMEKEMEIKMSIHDALDTLNLRDGKRFPLQYGTDH